jgi:cAMP-dependent protein kinase regulator
MKGKRTGVSSEKYGALNKKNDFKPRNIPKTSEQKFKIKAKLTQSILFNHLESDELGVIVQAMQEKVYE